MKTFHLAWLLCTMLIFVVVSVEEKDLYATLGIERDASDREIKKAFRKLSRRYHPDKNPGNAEAAEKFSQIAEAHEILSDQEQKFLYDDGGMERVQGEQQGGGGSPFDMFFGGGQQERRSRNKGPDTTLEMRVPLSMLFNGGQVSHPFERLVHCKGCTKGKRKAECRKCRTRCPNEIRMVERQIQPGFVVQQQQEVRSKEKCTMATVQLDVELEKGAPDGERITFAGKSEQRPGKFPGDVHIILKQEEHHFFKRSGKDLSISQDISLTEALVGFKKTITHLDNSQVLLSASGPTRPFQTRIIQDEGMPVHNFPSESGNLRVTYNVIFPKTLTDYQKEVIRNTLP